MKTKDTRAPSSQPVTTDDCRESRPSCPRCGNYRQVWRNQLTGKLTCHRAYCHTEIDESEVE